MDIKANLPRLGTRMMLLSMEKDFLIQRRNSRVQTLDQVLIEQA
jgi:hypothetical protein